MSLAVRTVTELATRLVGVTTPVGNRLAADTPATGGDAGTSSGFGNRATRCRSGLSGAGRATCGLAGRSVGATSTGGSRSGDADCWAWAMDRSSEYRETNATTPARKRLAAKTIRDTLV